MSISGASEKIGNSNSLVQEEMEMLQEYAEVFDKIMLSRNPSVHSAWKELSLLLSLTQQEANHKQPHIDTGPGPFAKLVRQVERSLAMENVMNKHVAGLQYQLDETKGRLTGLEKGYPEQSIKRNQKVDAWRPQGAHDATESSVEYDS